MLQDGCPTLCQIPLFTGIQYHVGVNRLGGPRLPPIVEKARPLWITWIVDRSDFGMETPDMTALAVLSRFANSIRWACIALEMEHRRPRTPRRATLLVDALWSIWKRFVAILLALWLLLPSLVRVQAYQALARVGASLYAPSNSLKVKRLPFGLYLKRTRLEWQESLANEYAALTLVRSRSSVPVPEALDLVSNGESFYLLTSRVPGYPLGMCIDTFSDGELAVLVQDLQQSVALLRTLRPAAVAESTICNTIGKACYDYRINAALDYDEQRGDFVGPFAGEDDFNDILRCGALPGVVHRAGHRIVFTHGDLNMRNVLVHDRKLSGIVDWENAGYYPEYWEYTKAHFVTRIKQRWLAVVDRVFDPLGDYGEDLQIERKLWEYCF